MLGETANALGFVVLMMLALLGGASGMMESETEEEATGGGSGEETDDLPEVAISSGQPIYDDTSGVDDGQVTGTDENDLIYGGLAADGPGGELTDATFPDDQIDAGDGDDVIAAGIGNDVVSGGLGSDVIDGGPGSDGLLGNDGDDVLNGGADDDVLFGGNGADILNGNAGNDELWGTASPEAELPDDGEADVLDGGAGDDTLGAGEGDVLTGGDGNDEFIIASGVTITDFRDEEGNADFMDLTPYYDFLQDARDDYAANGALTQVGDDPVVLIGVEANDLTTENTGLPIDAPPVAVDDFVTEDVEATAADLTITPLANDTDEDPPALQITSLAGTAVNPGDTIAYLWGSLTLANDGTTVGFSGDPSTTAQTTNEAGLILNFDFDYTVEDERGQSAEATVFVSLNVPPIEEEEEEPE